MQRKISPTNPTKPTKPYKVKGQQLRTVRRGQFYQKENTHVHPYSTQTHKNDNNDGISVTMWTYKHTDVRTYEPTHQDVE